jgi:ankyrin repeat protein
MHLVVMRRLALLILYVTATIACHYGPTSPAAAAASGGDVAAMKRLLDTGLDPNARDSAGYTPLIAAARAGNVTTIRLLTSRGADPNLRDAAVNSWTPLLHAIHKAQPGSTAALLDAGANPNGTDTNGTTPLMMAAGYGYTDIVKILLARGANPRLATNDGISAIDLARSGVPDIDRFTVFDCQDDTVKALLAADPKLPDHTDNLPRVARMLMRTKRCGA